MKIINCRVCNDEFSPRGNQSLCRKPECKIEQIKRNYTKCQNTKIRKPKLIA